MHTAYNPEMALHTTHRTKPAPASSLPTRRRASHVSKFCCTPCCATLRSGRRHSYTTACCTRPLPAACVPGTLVATLAIKAQAETPTVPRSYPPQTQGRLIQQRAAGPTRITSRIHRRRARLQPLPGWRSHTLQHAQLQMHVCVARPCAAACAVEAVSTRSSSENELQLTM